MKYTTLFLDLDNTLLDFSKAEAASIRLVFSEFGLPNDDKAIKSYSEINQVLWESFERGEITKDYIYEQRFKEFCSLYNITADTKAVSERYITALGQSYYTVEGAFEILDYLKAKGYFLCATTNGLAFTQYNRIKHSGLEPYFDKVFVSETAGSQKPEASYFDYVISNIPEKDKTKMLIIGDSESSDILGGINSGIDTCWYNPENESKTLNPSYEITDLMQLKEIL